MTDTTNARTAAGSADYDETIMAALLDALCSPQLYEIVSQGTELLIRPRPGMHAKTVS
jgi:hypothetical protein